MGNQRWPEPVPQLMMQPYTHMLIMECMEDGETVQRMVETGNLEECVQAMGESINTNKEFGYPEAKYWIEEVM